MPKETNRKKQIWRANARMQQQQKDRSQDTQTPTRPIPSYPILLCPISYHILSQHIFLRPILTIYIWGDAARASTSPCKWPADVNFWDTSSSNFRGWPSNFKGSELWAGSSRGSELWAGSSEGTEPLSRLPDLTSKQLRWPGPKNGDRSEVRRFGGLRLQDCDNFLK